MARRKMIPGKIPMWGMDVAVDWAEPEPNVDPDIMNKALFACGMALHDFLFFLFREVPSCILNILSTVSTVNCMFLF